MTKTNTIDSNKKGKNFFEKIGVWETKPSEKNSNEENTVVSENTENPASSFVFNFDETNNNTISEPIIANNKVDTKTSQSQSATYDPKIEGQLKKVMRDANFPGPDYYEFKQQLDALRDVITDEPTRFKAAFKTVQGLDKDKVAQSARKYVDILLAENNKFSEAISQKSDKDIELKTQEAKLLNTDNVNMQKQIEELKSKIEVNSQKIKSLGSEVQKAQGEINNAKKRFETTLNGFMSSIKDDANKVISYI